LVNTELGTLKKALATVSPRYRRIWVGVVGFGVLMAVIEAIAALLILVIFRLLDDPSEDSLPDIFESIGVTPEALSQNRRVFFIGCAVFFLVRGVLLMAQRYAQTRLDQAIGRDTSVRLFEAYMDMPYQAYLTRNSAELVRTAYWSVGEVVTHLITPVTTIVSESFIAISLIVVLLSVSPAGVGITLLVVVPLIGLILWVVRPKMHRLGSMAETAAASAIRTLNQALEGTRDLKLAQKEPYFVRAFRTQRIRTAVAHHWLGTLQVVPRVVLESTVFVALIGLLGFTTTTQGATSSLPIVGLFGYAAVRLLPTINRLSAAATKVRYGAPALDNVFAGLIADPASVAELDPRTYSPASEADLTFERSLVLSDLSFTYESGNFALVDVSLSISPGEFIGIVGPTGGGKTTLMDLTIGLLRPSSGRVMADGRDIHSNLLSWWSKISLVPQNVFILDETLRRNIALGIPDGQIDEDAVASAIDAAQLSDYIDSLPAGLDTVLGERGVRVSGGQRQRVAIARALYGNPELLFFDEGTAALDTITETALLSALENLRGRYTMISIAHRLASVERCDKIVLLMDGRVVDIGGYEELRQRNPMFGRMAG